LITIKKKAWLDTQKWVMRMKNREVLFIFHRGQGKG